HPQRRAAHPVDRGAARAGCRRPPGAVRPERRRPPGLLSRGFPAAVPDRREPRGGRGSDRAMSLLVRVQPPPGARLAEYTLEGDEAIIGRAQTAAIVISDARVSRHHARLVRRDNAWWIEDLGARNRTLLNGAPVLEPERIHPGDRVEVGEAFLRLVDTSTGTASTTV